MEPDGVLDLGAVGHPPLTTPPGHSRAFYQLQHAGSALSVILSCIPLPFGNVAIASPLRVEL